MKIDDYFLNKLALAFVLSFIPLILFADDFEDSYPIDVQEHRLTLNFEDIATRTVLQLLAEFSGYNLIVDDKVQGHLTLHLNNMPWQQALEIILQTQGLAKRAIPNGWLIATQGEFLQRDKKNLELQAQQKDLAPIVSKLLQIRYSKASDIAALLKDKNNLLLSARGNISIDKRSNNLWIQDSKDRLKAIEKVIRQLDKPVQQISIEARIVSIDQSRERELGVRFGLMPSSAPSAAPQNAETRKTRNSTSPHLTMDLPLPAEGVVGGGLSLGFHLMRLGTSALLDLELSALESEGGAQVISTPHLITADQQAAYIETGEDIPYQGKTADGSINVVFKKAVLALKVTPRVMPDRRLTLDLTVNQDQPSNFTVLDVPAIKARGIKTQVILKNGETVVLGGIYEHLQSQSIQRVPFLGALPIIGCLFRYKANSDKRNELLIFVTPTILDP
jgi:type IV pilus assembly protein PilQ